MKAETPTTIDAQLRALQPWVHKQARYFVQRLPASVDLDDVKQVGMTAAWKALLAWRPDKGANITTFAQHYVDGAMREHCRQCDVLPKEVRADVKRLRAARGSGATWAEAAQQVGITVARMHDLRAWAEPAAGVQADAYLGWDGLPGGCQEREPWEDLDEQRRLEQVDRLIAAMPPHWRAAVLGVLVEGLEHVEVARRLGLTPSRVSLLLGLAAARIAGAR